MPKQRNLRSRHRPDNPRSVHDSEFFDWDLRLSLIIKQDRNPHADVRTYTGDGTGAFVLQDSESLERARFFDTVLFQILKGICVRLDDGTLYPVELLATPEVLRDEP